MPSRRGAYASSLPSPLAWGRPAEPYAKAIETARRTVRLARELGIASISLVANKIRDASDLRLIDSVCAAFDVELTRTIPYDEAARLADQAGSRVIDAAPESALVTAVGRLAEAMCAPQPV